jgi:transposase
MPNGSELRARGDVVLAMVGVLEALNRAIANLDQSITRDLAQHPDAPVFGSLPRSGRITAA